MIEQGEALPSYSIQIETPDGDMHVHIVERDGMPCQVLINIGKAGTSVAAWGDALARMVTLALPHMSTNAIIVAISEITSERRRLQRFGGEVCRSGPDGLCKALMKYRAQKFRENALKKGPGDARLNG